MINDYIILSLHFYINRIYIIHRSDIMNDLYFDLCKVFVLFLNHFSKIYFLNQNYLLVIIEMSCLIVFIGASIMNVKKMTEMLN